MNQSLESSKVLNFKDIIKILPHRPPFLLVDKILDYDVESTWILGQKNVTINEYFFQGHFPDTPIMPGVLILESLAQTGNVLIYLKGYEKSAFLLNINKAKFRYPVRPGDILKLRCQAVHLSNKGGHFKAEAYIDDNNKLAVEAEIGFVLVDKAQY